MTQERVDYLSYLLRLWRDGEEEKADWRASLQSSLSDERQVFASLADLFGFLQRQTGTMYADDGSH